jgi:hypothetical protein
MGVRSLSGIDGDLFAGGQFFTVPNRVRIARLGDDPPQAGRWRPLGQGVAGTLNTSSLAALTQFDGEIVLGGDFAAVTQTDGSLLSTNSRCVFWDDSTGRWSAFDPPLFSASQSGAGIRAATVYANQLVVGGGFFAANGAPSANIAAWNGTQWLPLRSGMSGAVNALVVSQGDLYACGSFASADSITNTRGIARWNGEVWRNVFAGTNGSVNAAVVYQGKLYIGGSFTTVGSLPASNVASWDGINWRALGQGVTGGSVNGIAPYSLGLGFVGSFTRADGRIARSLATWSSGGAVNGISAEPVGLVRCPDATATFEVTTSGPGPFPYQWSKDGENLRDGRGILGVNSASHTIDNLQVSDSGAYSVRVLTPCGSSQSRNATLIVRTDNCPPVCDDIDDHNDGVFPDLTDEVAFLRVFSGGSCEP